MAPDNEDFHRLHEESGSPATWKEHAKVMKTWIRQPSHVLLCGLSAICILLLVIIIILVVIMSNGGVRQTEHSLRSNIRDLEVYIDSKVGGLSQDASNMLVKFQEMETSMTSLAKEKDVKDLGETQDKIFSAVSDVDALQTDVQRLLIAVGKLTDASIQGNQTRDPLCGAGWRHFALSCYYLSSRLRPWTFAKKDCEDRKSHLVIINNNEEQEEMRRFSGFQNTWIGLTDTDGTWKWMDGSKISSATSFWGDFQPSNYRYFGDRKNCALITSDGFWNNQHCSSSYQYICEQKA